MDEDKKTLEIELYVNINFTVNIRGYEAGSWHKDDDTKEIFYIDGIDNDEITTDETVEKRLNLTICYDKNLNFIIENCVMDLEIIPVGQNDIFS